MKLIIRRGLFSGSMLLVSAFAAAFALADDSILQTEAADVEQCLVADETFKDGDEVASCVSWDIKDLCCPGYCAAKNGSNWTKADDIFDSCIVGLGCKSKSTKGFHSCDCPKK